MKRIFNLIVCVLMPVIGAWAGTVTDLYDYNSNKIGEISIEGTSAVITFTVTDVSAQANTNDINNLVSSLTDVKVVGVLPSSVADMFNNGGYGFQNCSRMDFSETTAGVPNSVKQNNSVKAIILPSGSSPSIETKGGPQGVEYIIVANSGDAAGNELEVYVKKDNSTSWASDPYVDDASYINVYKLEQNGNTSTLVSDEVTALQQTKIVNGDGTVVTVEDLTIDADTQDEATVLSDFLDSGKLIKNLTVTGALDNLTLFENIEVKKDVNFSGITNSDLSTLKLPNTTGTISLPGGSYKNGVVTLASGYTEAQLTNILAALENSGLNVNSIVFPGGSTFNTNTKALEVSETDENEGNLSTIADQLRDAEFTIESVKLEKYGTSWADNKMTLASTHADQEESQKTLLQNAGFTVDSTKVTNFPDIEITVDDDGVVTITSYREGALEELFKPEYNNDLEAQAYKQILSDHQGEGSELVLVGPFKEQDLNKLKEKNYNSYETVDMRNATFSNANHAKFTYFNAQTLKTAYMSNDPKVTTITAQCFQNMGNIENLYIGESVTEIPDGRFAAYTPLRHVSIPSSVVTIGEAAFQGCTNLSDIDWGTNCHVETIEASAFERTNISDTFVVPNSVKTIGDQAFKDNNNLKTLIFTEYSQIQSIGHEAFAQAQSSDVGKLSDVYVNVSREVECANQAFDKYHTCGQTNVGTVRTRLHYPREYYEYYVGSYKETLYDQNLDQVVNGEVVHAYGVITQDILNRAFERAANGWQEFMSSGIPIGENSLYRTYSESVSYLVPQKGILELFLVDNYNKDENLAYCVQMEPGDLIPANTGFIIHSTTVSTVYLPYSKAVANPYNHEDYPNNVYKKGGVGNGYNNYMKPINGELHIDNVEIVNGVKTYRNYFFNNGTTAANRKNPKEWKDDYAVLGWGFFRAVSDDYTVWNKAFLHLPASMTDKDSAVLNDSGVLPQDQGGTQNPGGTNGAKSFGLYIIGADDDAVNYGITTSLNTASEVERNETGFYTLQGVKVNAPTAKGLYIHNGKKILVK